MRRVARRACAALSVAAALGLPAPAAARDEVPACERAPPGADRRPSPGQVRALLGWIGRNAGYDVGPALADPPAIRFCSTGETIEYEDRRVVVDRRLRAAYDVERRAIDLVRPWRPDDVRDRGTLLHELIHHVQLTSRAWSCWGKAEWQAYKLQEAWLAEQGVEFGLRLVADLRHHAVQRGRASRLDGVTGWRRGWGFRPGRSSLNDGVCQQRRRAFAREAS